MKYSKKEDEETYPSTTQEKTKNREKANAEKGKQNRNHRVTVTRAKPSPKDLNRKETTERGLAVGWKCCSGAVFTHFTANVLENCG